MTYVVKLNYNDGKEETVVRDNLADLSALLRTGGRMDGGYRFVCDWPTVTRVETFTYFSFYEYEPDGTYPKKLRRAGT